MEKESKPYTTTCTKGYLFCVKKSDPAFFNSQGNLKAGVNKPSVYDEITYLEPYNAEEAAVRLNKKHPGVKIKSEEILERLEFARLNRPEVIFFDERPRPVGQKVLEAELALERKEKSALMAEIEALKATAKAKSAGRKKKVDELQQSGNEA